MGARAKLFTLVLVGAGFGLSALIVEIALRVFGFDPVGELVAGREAILRASEHPLRGYELTPDSEGVAWRADVSISSQGLRDREYPLERGVGPRIAAIGDSITFGSGVTPDERFSDRLESLLTAQTSRPVEVINFGVGGYDTLQEVATLEHVGLRFDPDVVLVGFCVNDTEDNSPNLEYIESMQNLDSPLYRLRLVQLVRRALDKLRLIRWYEAVNTATRYEERNRDKILSIEGDADLERMRDELGDIIEREGEADFRLPYYLSEARLGKINFAFDRLATLSEEHGFKVVVAIIPFLEEISAYRVVYRMVAHLAAAYGFAVIELHAPLAGEGLAGLRSREEDPIHPDARGHELIALALAGPLREALP